MKSILGNIHCPSCRLETRFLLEKEEEEIVLLGDRIEDESEVSGVIECDYCQHEFTTHVVVIDQVISAFLNDNEYNKFAKGEFAVEKAKPNQGIEEEKKKSLNQFHETFQSKFSKHPLAPEDVFRVEGKVWVIKNVHRKENTERDLEKRLVQETHDEYWYKVHLKGNEKETRWIVVTDVEENNAILLQEAPAKRDIEEVYDVTDSLFETKYLFERELSGNFFIKAYEMLSGVRVLVYSKSDEEKEKQLELDVLADNLEDALVQIEEIFSITD